MLEVGGVAAVAVADIADIGDVGDVGDVVGVVGDVVGVVDVVEWNPKNVYERRRNMMESEEILALALRKKTWLENGSLDESAPF